MPAADLRNQQFDFVKQLADELVSGDIKLPSFPAVVMKIRALLEDDACDFEKVSGVVSADAVLVSKLFVYANSALYNRSGEAVTSLDAAISRLGLQVVKNTALSLAIRQLILAEKHREIVGEVKQIWTTSVHIASLSSAIAKGVGKVDEEDAFMCGLLHQIGKLYILSKAKDFPGFLGDRNSLLEVQNEWYQQVGRSIVEAWGFPNEVCESIDPNEFFDDHTHLEPALVDIVYAATRLLGKEEACWPEAMHLPVWKKLSLDETDIGAIGAAYKQKLAAVQLSLA